MKRRLALLALILVAVLIVAATALKFWTNSQKPDESRRGGTAAVVAYTVKPRTFTDRIEAIGTAQANEAATLTAAASDTVTAINFEEGARVSQGDVLVQLNDAEERASMEDARKVAERYSTLAKTSASSAAQRDTSAAELAMAEARLRDRQIIAPFDGITGFRNVSIGDLVTPGMAVTTLYDIDPIKLEFTLPENYLSIMEPGLEIEARTSAWVEETFKGKVTVVEPQVNAETRAIALKAEIANPHGKLKPGLLMTVNVVKNERQSLSIPEAAILQQGSNQNVYVIGADNKVALKTVKLGVRETGFVEILEGLSAGDTIVAEGLMKVRPGASVEIARTITIEDMMKDSAAMATDRKQKALK